MHVPNNHVNLESVFAFMKTWCIHTTSATTDITIQANMHILLTLPPNESGLKWRFSWPWTLTVLYTNSHSIKSSCDKNTLYQACIGSTFVHFLCNTTLILVIFSFLRYGSIVTIYWPTLVLHRHVLNTGYQLLFLWGDSTAIQNFYSIIRWKISGFYDSKLFALIVVKNLLQHTELHNPLWRT